MSIEIKLIKEMEYERISCTCGMAVLPRDPTPEISLKVSKIASEEGVRFSITDINVHPELLGDYNITKLPVVLIGKNIYGIDEKMIRKAIRREEHGRR